MGFLGCGDMSSDSEKADFRYDVIDIDKIKVSKLNVRKDISPESLNELELSIKEIGLQQPVVLTELDDGTFELVIGQRRFEAVKELGWKKIPALIKKYTSETDIIAASFVENIQRSELSYREKMNAALLLWNKFKKISEVARVLGVSEQTVRSYLGYEVVPEEVKKLVDEGKVGSNLALRLSRSFSNNEEIIRVAEAIASVKDSRTREKVVAVAKENPTIKSPDELIKKAKEIKGRILSVELTGAILNGLKRAEQETNLDQQTIVKDALEEWLRRRGYL